MASRGARKRSNQQYFQGNDVRLSKTLSYLLRHGAEKEGFTFTEGGFLYVDDVLKWSSLKTYTQEDILRVVENNDKKRFAVEQDEDTGRVKIRANQGHSVQVENLQLSPLIEASQYPVVIHGTYRKAWESIRSQGLSTMNRNHIHFAPGEPEDSGVISGMRKSCQVLIYLNLQKALEDGLQFFLSDNNVILSPGNCDGIISPKYFSKVMDRETGQSLDLQTNS
ncbi:tRNA 2'-phosphotransferase 1 isoform X2 [Lingula anatina]|uniref:2'-phosphotransferase n=1 Tax=Lingula anatina TaxID=7574 RepID=A0A1S3J7J8_LINAN|nr:tRNA 2'-phosphotransferase 1 isoform X2 [Lingula anatina]|eukprot:XP_013406375.1 tRNA 2'-phosphotransferase 1 isoform X2 [Lingula anatina]